MRYKVALMTEDDLFYYWTESYPDVQAIEAAGAWVHVVVFTAQPPAGLSAPRARRGGE